MTQHLMSFDDETVELVELGLEALEQKVRRARMQTHQGVLANRERERLQAEQPAAPMKQPRRASRKAPTASVFGVRRQR